MVLLSEKNCMYIRKTEFIHTDVLFKQLNLIKIDDILYKLRVLQFYYNFKHYSLTLQFSSFVIYRLLVESMG